MSGISRREFTATALTTLSTTAVSPSVAEEKKAKKKLPTVRWGNHEISKLLIGHNPLKGEGKIRLVLDNLKMFRDAGVLVGLGTHNHEVIDYVEDRGWDVDFYQCSFYRSWFSLDRTRKGELFEEEARQSMARTIQNVRKPCIAFKVLGANRHCRSPAAVERTRWQHRELVLGWSS